MVPSSAVLTGVTQPQDLCVLTVFLKILMTLAPVVFPSTFVGSSGGRGLTSQQIIPAVLLRKKMKAGFHS